MTGIYICMRCKKLFGPEGVEDPDYEKKRDGMVSISRYGETFEDIDCRIFCPECGRIVWDAMKEICDKKVEE